MEIVEVKTKKQIKAFIQFPKELYKNCTQYVPPLDEGEYRTLTQHPALEFCDLRMWLAYKEGKIVGRIAGIVNRKCNELKQQKRIRFSWFDTINDSEVVQSLINTVEQWGRELQLTEICGPSRFSNMEKQSMLIEGFDHTTSIASDYNYPYYPELIEAMGFQKEVDYIQFRVKVNETPESISRLAERVSQNNRFHFRKIRNRSQLKECGVELFEVLNKSYTHIFNFIPLTDKEIDWAIEENFQAAKLNTTSFLEDENGKMVGFAFCLPSLSNAFQKAEGKLFPFGWIHILKALKSNKFIDMYLTCVLPEYQNKGIHVLYHKKLNDDWYKRGYTYAFTTQQLEDNPAARIWSKYDAEPYFRRRCYIKSIDN